jgi:hypothetical protein
LKRERWGSPLVQEKSREEKACDRRRPYQIIIIIIIISDRTIPNTIPHIIIHDNEKVTCMLIDIAISGDRNVIKKEAEKILKYKDLTVEIQHMWNVKTKVIPVIIGATGTISKKKKKICEQHTGKT